AVALGPHGTHADARSVECGEHAVEVHRTRHVDVQRVDVGSGHRGALDQWQLRGQLTVDIQQEAFHVQLGQQLAHRALGDDLPMVDDGQVPAQVFGLFQVM